MTWIYNAESKGFEPLKVLPLTMLKIAALDHSANSLIIPSRLELE